MQHGAITKAANLAVDIVAAPAVVDAVAVADSEAGLGAIPPNRVLHEPRKNRWESRIKDTGVNPLSGHTNNVAATARPVAARAISMVRTKPAQDTGPVQEIVHQGVDGDHAAADLAPDGTAARRRQEDAGQSHRKDLVRNAVNVPQWRN